MAEWLSDFGVVIFQQSPGFPFRWDRVRGVIWHDTQGWCAEHAFDVFHTGLKCPHMTVGYREALDGSVNRIETKRRFQHVPLSLASYAVQHGDANHVCGTETNASGVIQIERVGFSADVVSEDEYRWLGEQVLRPILQAHPEIPAGVFDGGRMTEYEWAMWPGGQCGHRNVPCQPDGHSDPGDLDLAKIERYARQRPSTKKENKMILMRVIDDPKYPAPAGPEGLTGGVLLCWDGANVRWVQSAVVEKVYAGAGGVVSPVSTHDVQDLLINFPGVGASPSSAGTAIGW